MQRQFPQRIAIDPSKESFAIDLLGLDPTGVAIEELYGFGTHARRVFTQVEAVCQRCRWKKWCVVRIGLPHGFAFPIGAVFSNPLGKSANELGCISETLDLIWSVPMVRQTVVAKRWIQFG